MILYYTGTGNSEYVAKKIGRYVEDEVVNLFDKLRGKDYSPMESEKPWVIVAPTYAWQMPHIVRDWLRKTKLKGNKKIYFVLTCGAGIGNAGAYAKEICDTKKMEYMGCAKIVMPENYIAMFKAPDKAEAKQIIKKAQASIRVTAEIIKAEVYNDTYKPGIVGKLMSGIVNKIFYRFIISSEKFYAKDTCIFCGKCEKVCPMSNVNTSNGKPMWGNECTHCMACICSCPTESIEYGTGTHGKVRYTFPKK